MAAEMCGTSIGPANAPGTIGCLVAYVDNPNTVYLLTAMHVLVGAAAQRGDLVYSLASPGEPLGRLRSWTKLGGDTTVDAALVWIDPRRVSPQIVGLHPIAGINNAPKAADPVYLMPDMPDGAKRSSAVQQPSGSADLTVAAEGWSIQDQTYQNQVICSPMFSHRGDSGAMVLDAQNRVVGMVVGAMSDVVVNGQHVNQTIVTPIQAILDHPDLNGGQAVQSGQGLKVLSAIPAQAVAPDPPLPSATPPAPAAPPPVAPADRAGSDTDRTAGLIALASDAVKLQRAQHGAAQKLLNFDGEVYPSDGCAITLSLLLQMAGIAVPDTFEALALGNYLAERRGWTRIDVGDQEPGDVGSTCGDVPHHGTDHIYFVLERLNPDEMLIADNQAAGPHFRYASGTDGKTPTRFFLRASS